MLSYISLKNVEHSTINRYFAVFVFLTLSNKKGALFKINIIIRERKNFPHAHSRTVQKPKDNRILYCGNRFITINSLKEFNQFLVSKDIRDKATPIVSVWQSRVDVCRIAMGIHVPCEFSDIGYPFASIIERLVR